MPSPVYVYSKSYTRIHVYAGSYTHVHVYTRSHIRIYARSYIRHALVLHAARLPCGAWRLADVRSYTRIYQILYTSCTRICQIVYTSYIRICQTSYASYVRIYQILYTSLARGAAPVGRVAPRRRQVKLSGRTPSRPSIICTKYWPLLENRDGNRYR